MATKILSLNLLTITFKLLPAILFMAKSLISCSGQDVESILELNFEEASTPMGPSGPHSNSYTLIARLMRIGLTLD